jgi:signal transduction histidine kinase
VTRAVAARLVPVNRIAGISEIQLIKAETTIGRSRQSDIHLEDPSVSRVHARISVVDGAYSIKDSGSLHGTKVNGKSVTTHVLADNDVIELGIYSLKFVASEGDAMPEHTAVSMEQVAQTDHLQLILDVTRMINSSLALDEVLQQVIDAVIQVTRAERGFLMTIGSTGDLEFRAGRNFDRTALQTDGVFVSDSIVDQVRRTGEPVVLSDTLDPEALGPQSVVQLGLRSVMCVPLKTHENLIGVIYVDSHRRAKRFSAGDLQLFQSLANQAALAIEKGQLYEQLREYNASLEEQVQARTLELVQAEKLATVGRLAAGIAHEINSPLGVLASNLDMLDHLIREPGRPNAKELMEDVARSSAAATKRLRGIVKAFETFAGLDEAEIQSININDAIEDVLEFASHQIPPRIKIVKELGQLERFLCSPAQIHQALMNLLMNAVQAIKDEGVVELRTEHQADKIRITIRDTGKGMSADELARIFDPTFTKKRDRVGVSMGLIITAQIIRSHEGNIHFESTPGEGTSVTLLLPRKTKAR